MCGIAGIISYNSQVKQHALQQMANALQHRGPNNEGYWINNQQHIGFAHRRLSIIDLSNAASQPMHYLHYTLVFNGEIYNYKELRSQLTASGYSFTSAGDTEVIPAAYDCWGIGFLHRLDGMFAFALYNSKTNFTLIVRDRFGEKPLFYTNHAPLLKPSGIAGLPFATVNQGLLFASEMKAFWAVGVPRQVQETMLLNYLGMGVVKHPNNKAATFFKDVFSLPPGYYLQLNHDNRTQQVLQWYNPQEGIAAAGNTAFTQVQQQDQFIALLSESVNHRLRSDVPVGTSLSGGLDSSAIVAVAHKLLQGSKHSQFSYNCFTAIFPGFKKNEAAYAEQVAASFNLKQYTISPGATDFFAAWKQLMHHQEEPMQSSSVFTQYMVYAMARQQGITVLLDGQGADETLGGYTKYSNWHLQQLLRQSPANFFKEKKLLTTNGFGESWRIKHYAAAFMPQLAGRLLSLKAKNQVMALPFANAAFVREYADEASWQKPAIRSLNEMLYYNTFQFGLEELLRYADRNSMTHSIEVRLPFLYHKLVEFVFSLPANQKIQQGFTKWILRKTMHNMLPDTISWRKGKIGYEPPQKQWMQNPAFHEMIVESRRILVENDILSNKIMQQPVKPSSAHEGNNYDWRFVNAAAIINEAL